MERFDIPYLNVSVYLWLFSHLKNASELRTSLVHASTLDQSDPLAALERARLDWSFLNPRLITSSEHLRAAIYQALLARAHHQLKTKTVHSEIMWTLSPGTNITDAIKKFGLDPTSSSLVLVKICDLETDINRQASDALHDLALKLVDGQLMPLGDIQTTTTNWKEVRKVYKLNEDRAIKQLDIKVMQGTAHAQELHELIDQLVISTVALKTVAG